MYEVKRMSRLTIYRAYCKGSCIVPHRTMMLVHWPLMGGLLHLVQKGWDWAGPQPTQTHPRCTKCNSPPINSQCTNHRIAVGL